jgi:hypothetical protein
MTGPDPGQRLGEPSLRSSTGTNSPYSEVMIAHAGDPDDSRSPVSSASFVADEAAHLATDVTARGERVSDMGGSD